MTDEKREPMEQGFINTIHETVMFGENVIIGGYNFLDEGVVIGDNTKLQNYIELRKDTIIGKNCYIDSRVNTSGGCKIGDGVTLRYNAIIARGVIIEDDVFISPRVMFIFSDHKGVKHPGTVIGKGCHIGTNAVIGPNVKICPGAVIGAMTFVNRDVTEPGIYTGIPATLKKKL